MRHIFMNLTMNSKVKSWEEFEVLFGCSENTGKNYLDLLLLIHKKVFQNKFHLQKINCIFKKYFLDHFLGSFCFSALRTEGAACQRADSCVQARKLLELL